MKRKKKTFPYRNQCVDIHVVLFYHTKLRVWLRLLIINVRLYFKQLNNFQVDKQATQLLIQTEACVHSQ